MIHSAGSREGTQPVKSTTVGLRALACGALVTASLMLLATAALAQDPAKLETVGLRRIAFSDGDRPPRRRRHADAAGTQYRFRRPAHPRAPGW